MKYEIRKLDWILATTVIILTVIGLAMIYSVDLSRGTGVRVFPTQLIALGIAILVLIASSYFHLSLYESLAKPLYIVSALLLIGVLIFGTTIRGTTGWFRVAGFSFQPAEFAKIALILFLAWRTERQARRFEQWQFIAVTALPTALLSGLILLQPDLGSALILAGLWFGILLLTGTQTKYILSLLAIGIVTFVIGWFFLFHDYQKERILTFIHPGRDPLGGGYNVTQSIIAVGAGELWGRGLGFGSQSQLHFLPEAQTDFIFSVIGEELGFFGVMVVLGLYMIIIWRLIMITRESRSDFGAYTVLGIAVVYILHIVVNIGGAIGLLPVTGVTLPFVSYGGSSLIMNFALIGIAESAAQSFRRYS